MKTIPPFILVLVLGITLFAGCVEEVPSEKCSLSLCDCKCYPEGQTPEEVKGVLCGINCLGEYGVIGCEFKEGECKEQHITEEDSKDIAMNFMLNTQTYKFDGFDLAYVETTILRCPFCWQFTYEFKSKYMGYGDRTDQVIAQVITDHKVVVTVNKGTITTVIIDEKWDEINDKFLFSDEKSCSTDSDCACGVHKETGDCLYGNKDYVNMSKQCPDFCTGIGGNLEIKCVENRCIQINKRTYCSSDSDCVPEQCCHPTSCVNREFAPDCTGAFCTEICQGPIDCGAGKCKCENGVCSVESTGTKW